MQTVIDIHANGMRRTHRAPFSQTKLAFFLHAKKKGQRMRSIVVICLMVLGLIIERTSQLHCVTLIGCYSYGADTAGLRSHHLGRFLNGFGP